MPPAPSRAMRVLAAAAIAVAVLVGVVVGDGAPVGSRPRLSAALGTLPASVTAVGFTDWGRALAEQRVGTAARRDLMTRSVVRDLDPELRSLLGLRSADLEWEAYGQGPSHKALLARVDDRAGPNPTRLRRAGYVHRDGMWLAGRASSARGSIVGTVAWVPNRRLLIASSTPVHVQPVLDVLGGRAPALASDPDVRATAAPLAGSVSVLLEPGAAGCLATTADITPEAARQAQAAQDRFGRLARYRYLGRGLSDVDGERNTQRFVVAMSFASARVATTQARVRTSLSSGPFIGRLGSIDEVLRLQSTRTDGPTVVLTYDHPADSQLLMTGRGPLLPATC